MKKNFVVIVDEYQAKKYFTDQIKNATILALTPDSFFFLKKKHIKNILNPYLILKKKHIKKILIDNYNLKKQINILFKNNNKISLVEKENFKNIILQFYSSINYIWQTLPNNSNIYIYKNNKVKKTNKLKAHSEIVKYVKLKKMGIFNLNVNDSVYCFYYLKKIINYFILNKFKNKKIIFSSDNSSEVQNISKEILKKNKNITFFYFAKISKKFLLFFLLIFNFLKIILNINTNIISIYPNLKKKNFLFKKKIVNQLIKQLQFPLIKNNSELFTIFFSEIFCYISSIKNFLKKNTIFEKKTKLFIANHLTWTDNSIIGYFLKEKNKKVLLASHGITMTSKNFYSKLELKNLDNGLISSPFATSIFAQSPSAYNAAILDEKHEIKIIKSHPIMYNGLRTLKSINNNSGKQTILFANTYKVFASRPWIYETSFEFLENLKIICEVVKKLKNTQLLIKIRINDELSIETIKNYIQPTKNILFYTSGSIKDFCDKADLLITGFSTVIEEFLYLKKPVIIFGKKRNFYPYNNDNKIDKIINSQSLRPIYYFDEKNINENLIKVLNLLKTKKINKNLLKKYIWGGKNFLHNKNIIEIASEIINEV